MKCVFYQSKKRSQCTECDEQVVSEPEVIVNNLLKDGNKRTQNGWEFINKRDFSPWCQGNQECTVLIFKYTPPSISDLHHQLVPVTGQVNNKQSQQLKEFCPEYSSIPWSSHLSNQTLKSRASLKSNGGSTLLSDCSLNFNYHKNEIVSSGQKEGGSWCVFSVLSSCTSKQKEPILSSKFPRGVSPPAVKESYKNDIQRLKRKYHISNHHRGKWLISTKESINSCMWKEICKMVSSCELLHCNAKYQRMMKEIWLYCDFIDSFSIGQTEAAYHSSLVILYPSLWHHNKDIAFFPTLWHKWKRKKRMWGLHEEELIEKEKGFGLKLNRKRSEKNSMSSRVKGVHEKILPTFRSPA